MWTALMQIFVKWIYYFFLTNISVVFFQKCKCMYLLCKVDANYFYFVFFISKVKQRYNHQVFKIYAQKIFHFISKVIQRFKHHLCNDYAKKSFVCLSFQLFSFIRILVYNRYFWFYSKSYVMIFYHPKFMQREKNSYSFPVLYQILCNDVISQ